MLRASKAKIKMTHINMCLEGLFYTKVNKFNIHCMSTVENVLIWLFFLLYLSANKNN